MKFIGACAISYNAFLNPILQGYIKPQYRVQSFFQFTSRFEGLTQPPVETVLPGLRAIMANPLSLEELFCDLVPEEKRHLLDSIVKDDHLTVFAENLTHWQEIAPYLELTEAEEAAIERNYGREERRRFVG